MSYPPLGYTTYTAPTPANLTASQLLLSQATPPTLSPSTPTPTNSPSCNIETRPTTLTSADPVTSPTTQNVYTSGLLNYPSARMPGLTETMSTLYNTAYATQGYVPFGTDPSAFYSPLAGNNTDAWRNLQGGAWPYDPTMAAYPYSTGYGGLDVRRKNATREATSTLKAWLYEHIKNPYPTKGEKIMLAIITKMTLTQVSTWFANARRRLKKENKMQWSPRNRSGEDEDEDDKDSDTEQGDNREDRRENCGKTGGGRADDKDVEDDEDDEDIIVDGCTANDSFKLLSPGDKSDDSSLLDLRDTSSCLDMSVIGQQQGNVPHASFSASTSPVESSHITNSYLNPSSNLSDPKDPLQHYATSNTQHQHQQHQHPPNHQQHPHHHHHVHHPLPKDSTTAQNSSSQGNNKPRIWSMADMATPSQPQLDTRRSPTAIAQSLISKSGYTAFTSPTSQPHPALNGSYHGLASANAAASTGLSPYRLANYMAAPGGGGCGAGVHVPCSSVAPGILPNFHRPTSISVLASAAAGPGSCSQRITPGVLGSPLDGSRLGGSLATNPLSNTATAFKPVPRRS